MNKESEKMLVVTSLGMKGRVPRLGSHWESNPEPPTSATSALTTELRQPDNHQHFNFSLSSFSLIPALFQCEVRLALPSLLNHSCDHQVSYVPGCNQNGMFIK